MDVHDTPFTEGGLPGLAGARGTLRGTRPQFFYHNTFPWHPEPRREGDGTVKGAPRSRRGGTRARLVAIWFALTMPLVPRLWS